MNTFKKTPEEMYQLILECRRSGLSDLDWCMEKGIKYEAFRTWVRRLKLKRDPRFPIPPATVTSSCRLPANESVQMDVLSEENLQEPDDKNTFIPPAMLQTAPSIEIEAHGVTIRFFDPVDASLYEKTLLMTGNIFVKNNP